MGLSKVVYSAIFDKGIILFCGSGLVIRNLKKGKTAVILEPDRGYYI